MIRRRVPPLLRAELFQRSEGQCERRCGRAIVLESFHAAHLRAVANGGATVPENLEAWCAPCNWSQGATDVRDTRLAPRGWQIEGLTAPNIPELIIRQGMATVAAAPGSGKTLFAGLIFETLYDAGFVDRAVIFVPRLALIEQWQKALYTGRHLDFSAGQAHERAQTLGTIVLYQSLNSQSVPIHQRRARDARTLVIFDEVHHLGEPPGQSGQRPAWARYAMDIAGELGAFNVAGVLNLSGTLWRTGRGQRISTVRYEELDGRLLSLVDLDVPAVRLIREGLLRPVDLYRRGGTVELVDLSTATQIVGDIADLDEDGLGRAVLRDLATDSGWRVAFVDAVLERLERAYRGLDGAPVKALIVAASQADARAFQATANERMRARGLQPFTELAISEDDRAAAAVLKKFKTQSRPGVLCTVDMAGEGYDCPDIIVIGYATHKLTPLYIRQVVARAQRVTPRERERQILPAAIVIPDVPALVQHMANVLQPIRHELDDEPRAREPREGRDVHPRRYALGEVTDIYDGVAHVTGVENGEVPMDDVRSFEPYLRDVGQPEPIAARVLHAARSWARGKREDQPFDPLAPEDRDLAEAPAAEDRHRPGLRREPIAESQHAQRIQADLAALERWWKKNGSTAIADFASAANRAARIPTGGRAQASRPQLEQARAWAWDRIVAHCAATGLPRPRVWR
jgi:superfamily II DNA or RNA helicase